jgi:antitoxin ParD1/3/4
VRAGLRALDREEAALDGWLRTRVDEAFAYPGLSIPADRFFRDFGSITRPA